MKTLRDLVGYKLIDISEEGITVAKGGEEYFLHFYIKEGDCCGYSNITANLLTDGEYKPVITRVEYREADEDFKKNVDADKLTVVLYGLYKPLAEIQSYSSSDSGWCYGSAVTVVCEAIDIEETLTQW